MLAMAATVACADQPNNFAAGRRPNGFPPHDTSGGRSLGAADFLFASRIAAPAIQFAGANSRAEPTEHDLQPGKLNYLVGRDSSTWRTNLPHYSRVEYHDLYPGIDIIYYTNNDQFEYDLIVAPHANPAQVQIELATAGKARIAANGDFTLDQGTGELRMLKPVVYQEVDGVRKHITGRYILKRHNRLAFKIGAYDHSKPLIIDPVVTYSTYLGGSSDETAYAVTTDSAGNTYVAGSTDSVDFPASASAYKATAPGGATDVFVAKYSPTGTLLWSTYLGGSGADVAYGIAVDSSGNVYVTGSTSSPDFPTTPGAYKTSYQGGVSDGFIVKLNSAGNSILYSTYIGGSGEDIAYGVALDASNEPTIAGSTSSTDFPTATGAYATSYAGGITDAFAARLNAAGTGLVYATYLGGGGEDVAYGVALDSKGNAYVTGYTQSANFPATTGTTQTANAGGYDAFVTALNPSGKALVYSTYLGGSGDDFGLGIAADASGDAYITGYTTSLNYPDTAGALQTAKNTGYDAIVTKLNPTGNLVYSTFLGGSEDDYGYAIAVDSNGNVYVTGSTASTDFPVVNPTQAALDGEANVFVAEVNPAATALVTSTYVGGSLSDTAYGIALDSQNGVEVAGTTASPNFPVAASPQQINLNGPSDAFVTRLNFTINSTNQTITFGALSNVTLGVTPFSINATASSGLAVIFSSTTVSVCTVTGGTVTAIATGTCSITASQAGSANYAAATPVVQSFSVTTAQTISFGELSNVAFGAAPFTVSATASSGLPVAFTSTTTSVCTISGSTVTLVTSGTCAIQASQTGNSTYGAATPVVQSFTVNIAGSTSQTITFGMIGNVTFGTVPFSLSATATSGLAVSFASNSPAVCTVAGTMVTISGAGTCSVTATQAGNGTYGVATPATQTFTVNPAPQTITFGAVSPITLPASSFALAATASSGLAITYSSTTTSVCTVSGSTVSPVTSGTCTITASQPGNANYAAATPVTQSFTINPAASTGGGGGGGGGGSVGGGSPLTAAPTSLTINASTGGAPGTAIVTLSFATFTQGAPTFASNFNTNPGQGWLKVSPGSGTMTQASFASFLYTYTATITISADPTGIPPGSAYSGTVNFSAGGGIVSVPIAFNISSQPAKYNVAPQALNFAYQLGASSTPASQSLAIFSTPTGGTFTATASSTGNWLTAGTGGTTPASIPVNVNTASLKAGTYNGTVTITSGTTISIPVPVSLTITPAAPAVLNVSPAMESISVIQGGSPQTGQINVSNTGGGTLQFRAQVSSGSAWLNLTSASATGSAIPGSPASINFTATPSTLSPGVYNGQITISDQNSSAQSNVAVVLTVTAAASQIQLSKNGVSLTAVSGGGTPQPQTVEISNSGAGSLAWTTQISTSSGGNWLALSQASGTLGSAAGTELSISTNASVLSSLAAGQYYGSISFLANNAVNSPQSVSVVLNILPAAAPPGISVSTGGVAFVGIAGSSTPASQSVTLYNPTASGITYSASPFTATSGTSWLAASPASGTLNPGSNSIAIQASLASLTSGIQSGSVTLSFGDGTSQTIQVVVLVLNGLTGSARTDLRPMASLSTCPSGKPSFLIPIFRQPLGNTAEQVASATTVQAQVIDDCGNPVTAANGGSVHITFSSADSGIALNDTGSGIWEATWVPANAATSVTLQVVASENGLTNNASLSALSTVTVSVNAANANAAPQPTGIANAASAGQAIPGVVSPLSYIAIYGTGLAGTGSPAASSLPLPTTLNGTQLLLGGIPMPLLYASAGQVNALVPEGIVPNATYPLVVVRGAAQSVPVALTVTELQPGAYTVNTSGSGAGIVTNAITGSLITSTNPAHAGDYLVIYATGLGALTGPNGETEPTDGAAAPTTLIYSTTSTVTATIGGVPSTVFFAGLTPTFAGLYQVNVQVPTGAAPGTAVPIVLTATDPTTGATATSNAVTITIQ